MTNAVQRTIVTPLREESVKSERENALFDALRAALVDRPTGSRRIRGESFVPAGDEWKVFGHNVTVPPEKIRPPESK